MPRATHGTTQVLKLARFAKFQGARVELNGPGGICGLVHAHVGCCLENTSLCEYFGSTADTLRREGRGWGLLNAPLIENGHIAPPDGPGWGAEWDEERFQRLTVARHRVRPSPRLSADPANPAGSEPKVDTDDGQSVSLLGRMLPWARHDERQTETRLSRSLADAHMGERT